MSDKPKLTDAEINVLLAECPIPLSMWRHYKGSLYQIVACAYDETHEQAVVVYRSIRSLICFTRPLASWRENIGDNQPRYKRVEL